MILIPITNDPNQTFSVTIPGGTGENPSNQTLQFFVFYNDLGGFWQMTLTDATSGDELIADIPLVGGNIPVGDVFYQYQYLNLGPIYILPLSTATSDYPGVSDWQTNFVMGWGNP